MPDILDAYAYLKSQKDEGLHAHRTATGATNDDVGRRRRAGGGVYSQGPHDEARLAVSPRAGPRACEAAPYRSTAVFRLPVRSCWGHSEPRLCLVALEMSHHHTQGAGVAALPVNRYLRDIYRLHIIQSLLILLDYFSFLMPSLSIVREPGASYPYSSGPSSGSSDGEIITALRSGSLPNVLSNGHIGLLILLCPNRTKS